MKSEQRKPKSRKETEHEERKRELMKIVPKR
jgi:hypothetical protein